MQRGEWWYHVLREECLERNRHKGWNQELHCGHVESETPIKYPRRDVTLAVGAHGEVKERIIHEHIDGCESHGSCRATYRQSGGRKKKRADGRALGLSSVNQIGRGVTADK